MAGCEYYEHELKRKDCALYLGEFRFELRADIDMLLFEKGIMGGINQTVKHISSVFRHKNIYRWNMIQKLPTHGFAWERVDDFTSENRYTC